MNTCLYKCIHYFFLFSSHDKRFLLWNRFLNFRGGSDYLFEFQTTKTEKVRDVMTSNLSIQFNDRVSRCSKLTWNSLNHSANCHYENFWSIHTIHSILQYFLLVKNAEVDCFRKVELSIFWLLYFVQLLIA